MEKYVVKNITRPSEQMLKEYSQLDSSTIYEAQGKQGLLSHELKGTIQGAKLCGAVVTVTCPTGDNLMVHAAIEVCKPGDILVISTIGNSIAGMVGELITSALIKRGVKGIITEAGIRDVTQLRALNFPVWTRSIYSQGNNKSKGGWVNAPIVCGGILVNPGDLIMADDDGVVVVHKSDLQSTLDATKARVLKEKGTKEKIANGELSLDFYNLRPTLEKEGVIYYENETDIK